MRFTDTHSRPFPLDAVFAAHLAEVRGRLSNWMRARRIVRVLEQETQLEIRTSAGRHTVKAELRRKPGAIVRDED